LRALRVAPALGANGVRVDVNCVTKRFDARLRRSGERVLSTTVSTPNTPPVRRAWPFVTSPLAR
jgi:hypothetical protein